MEEDVIRIDKITAWMEGNRQSAVALGATPLQILEINTLKSEFVSLQEKKKTALALLNNIEKVLTEITTKNDTSRAGRVKTWLEEQKQQLLKDDFYKQLVPQVDEGIGKFDKIVKGEKKETTTENETINWVTGGENEHNIIYRGVENILESTGLQTVKTPPVEEPPNEVKNSAPVTKATATPKEEVEAVKKEKERINSQLQEAESLGMQFLQQLNTAIGKLINIGHPPFKKEQESDIIILQVETKTIEDSLRQIYAVLDEDSKLPEPYAEEANLAKEIKKRLDAAKEKIAKNPKETTDNPKSAEAQKEQKSAQPPDVDIAHSPKGEQKENFEVSSLNDGGNLLLAPGKTLTINNTDRGSYWGNPLMVKSITRESEHQWDIEIVEIIENKHIYFGFDDNSNIHLGGSGKNDYEVVVGKTQGSYVLQKKVEEKNNVQEKQSVQIPVSTNTPTMEKNGLDTHSLEELANWMNSDLPPKKKINDEIFNRTFPGRFNDP
ncbi:MAG: hypothetical protein WCJ84_04440 [Candidatus Peregrinibacteria bacterium]